MSENCQECGIVLDDFTDDSCSDCGETGDEDGEE